MLCLATLHGVAIGKNLLQPQNKLLRKPHCYDISGNASQPNFCVAILSIATIFGILQHF